MTATRWEYAQVIGTYVRRKITRDDPAAAKLGADELKAWDEGAWSYNWWWDNWVTISLPGVTEPERRLAGSSDPTVRTVGMHEIYNELGAEGWEMVNADVMASATDEGTGFETASQPVQVRAIFKRPVSN